MSAVARLRLARCEGVGPIAYRRLLARYRTPEAALDALPRLAREGGRSAFTVTSKAAAERELEALADLGGRMLFLGEEEYPPLLAETEDAPPALAVLGSVAALSARAVAVVGARDASANGRRFAEAISAELAQAGFVVVSGLARGIDTAAHEGALAAGRTVAAVAGGIDKPYPAQNAALQARIADAGAVVAEAPLGTAPLARHFPRRNRVIAGLSLGVVVVEAAPRSGSLITARLALEAGRELFAVPGSPFDPRSRGCNDLIRQGAIVTEGLDDVVKNLPQAPRSGAPLLSSRALFEPQPEWAEPPETPAELRTARQEVIDLLGPSPTSVDDLLRRCQFSAAAVMAALLDLELAGRVETLPGQRVSLVAEPGPWGPDRME